jgi:hypothetical protein
MGFGKVTFSSSIGMAWAEEVAFLVNDIIVSGGVVNLYGGGGGGES